MDTGLKKTQIAFIVLFFLLFAGLVTALAIAVVAYLQSSAITARAVSLDAARLYTYLLSDANLLNDPTDSARYVFIIPVGPGIPTASSTTERIVNIVIQNKDRSYLGSLPFWLGPTDRATLETAKVDPAVPLVPGNEYLYISVPKTVAAAIGLVVGSAVPPAASWTAVLVVTRRLLAPV